MSVEKEINLASIIEVMWLRARGILLFTFATVLLAMIATLAIKNRYNATTKVIMNKSKLGEHTMQNPSIQMKTYLEMATDDELLQNLLQEYKLTEPPYNFLYRDDLMSRIEIEDIEETSLIVITVQLENPETAASVANDVAQDLIQKTKNLMQMEFLSSSTSIAEQVKQVSNEVDSNRKVYEDMLINNNKMQVQHNLDTTNSILALERQQQANLESIIIQHRTKSSVLATALSATDFNPVITTNNNVVLNPIVEATVRQQTDNLDLETLSKINFLNENINPEYLAMKREYETILADLAAAEAQLADKEIKIASLEVKANHLESKFHKMNLEEMVAKAEFDRSLEILGGVDKQEGWAGTSVVTERQDLFQVVKAIPPDKKSYPQRSLMVGIVGSMAFLLSFMYYLLRDLYGLLKDKATTGEQGSLF